MGGSSTVRTSDQKIDSFHISSSAYGLPIPLVWGRNRVAGNILDYTDFTATPHTTSQHSGKGGGVTQENTTYTYTVALDVLLCEGTVSSVPNVWASKDQYTLSQLQFSLANGSRPQNGWSYMKTYHPERALSYAGMAHVAGVYNLDSSGSLPSLTFEVDKGNGAVAGVYDAAPDYILTDFLTNQFYGAGINSQYIGDWTSFKAFCYAYGVFLSPVLDSQQQASDFFTAIMQATNSNVLWSEGLLKIIPYCTEAKTANGYTFTPNLTPIYDLTDDDYIVDGDNSLNDAVEVTRDSTADAFNSVQVEYLDRANQYNAEIVEARDQANVEDCGLRQQDPIQLHAICNVATARTIAQAILNRVLYIRNTYQFNLSWRYCLLEPMDLVTLTDTTLGLNKSVVRITQKQENADGTLTFTAEECPTGVYGLTQYPTANAERTFMNFNISAGNSLTPVIFEPPAELSSSGGLELWMALAGQSNLWGGAVVYVSYDGSTYNPIGNINQTARYGILTSELKAGTAIDGVNTLNVDISASGGSLSGVSQGDFTSNNTLCYVDGEFLAYRDATLLGTGRYALSPLNRGLYNSTIRDHSAGGAFVRIDGAIFKYAYKREDVGKTVYLKFASFNVFNGQVQDLADIDPIEYTITGSGGAITSVPFTVSQSGTDLICGVTKQVTDTSGNSFYTYELREGALWDSSELIGQFSTDKYTFKASKEGTLTYWLKTIDQYGNYSAEATECIVNILGLPPTNVLLTTSPDPSTWTANGMYLDLDGWHLSSVREVEDFPTFASMFGNPPVLRQDAYVDLPIIDLGANILDPNAYYFDRNGMAKLRTVELLGDYPTFGNIFNTPVSYVPPQFAVETILGVDITYNAGAGVRCEYEYMSSIDGVAWTGWTASAVKQFYGRYIKIRIIPTSLDGVTPVIVSGVSITIDVPDVEDDLLNIPLVAGVNTVYYDQMFTNTPVVSVFTQDATGTSCTNRISNVTNKSFQITLLDANGNPIAGTLTRATIRGY